MLLLSQQKPRPTLTLPKFVKFSVRIFINILFHSFKIQVSFAVTFKNTHVSSQIYYLHCTYVLHTTLKLTAIIPNTFLIDFHNGD